MFKNYVVIAIRNMIRHKVYSLISVLGLAVGIACCIPILLYVQDELGYDSHLTQKDRIYRVLRATEDSDGSAVFGKGAPGAVSVALEADYPEVTNAVRTWSRDRWFRYEDRSFVQRICMADPEVVSAFDLKVLQGDLNTALLQPRSMVITQETAAKIFGDENPIDKVISTDAHYFRGDYTITGVIQNLPKNASLQFDLLTSTVLTADAKRRWVEWSHNTSWHPIVNYVVLSPNANVEALQQKLIASAARYQSEVASAPITYHLQPVTRIHLYTRQDFDIDEGGDIISVYVLSGMACFILFIACINFVNLATARSVRRAREVGMRKVVGADRRQLIGQFLGEAILFTMFALVLALALVDFVLPAFNELVERQLVFDLFAQLEWTLVLVGITLFAGLLAGSYPALFLSSFRPTEVLKSNAGKLSQGVRLRQGLVVFQFAISIFLIVGTLVVQGQMGFMQNKNLGFDKGQVLLTPLFYFDKAFNPQSNGQLTPRYNEVKQAFLQIPGVVKASASRGMPGSRFRYDVVLPEGHQDTRWQMHVLPADEDFLDFFGLELVAGRNFLPGNASDATQAYILNETAVKQLGWVDDPIGKQFEWPEEKGVNRKGRVIGVVKDFHMDSLHKQTGPAVICMQLQIMHWMSWKIKTQDMDATLAAIGKVYKRFIPNMPFEPHFLDDYLTQRYYQDEIRLAKIFNTASLIAIFIACLGLFGLAAFTTEQRTKDVSIRKMLGASMGQIMLLLCKEFALLVLVANVIAWPVAYYAMQGWLDGFAYRIDLGVWSFLFGGAMALLIALTTVSYQAVRAAWINPVDALRNE